MATTTGISNKPWLGVAIMTRSAAVQKAEEKNT
jgi:hypothetical protein